ncbi:hypothetical protein LCGC14_0332270 [marine sediment metagenome]|uniref:Uncharacterized protein n=1 Tax=marine sediment metagenome TaxID=412755 RepID=A0A0F9WNK9_9ZZZZ
MAKQDLIRTLLADSQPEPCAPIMDSSYVALHEGQAALEEEGQGREAVRLEEADKTDAELQAGLKSFVATYIKQRAAGNVRGAKQTKKNIDRIIREKGLDAKKVYSVQGDPDDPQRRESVNEADQGHNVPFKTNELGKKPARVGIRMPTNPGSAPDLRTVNGYTEDGTMVGFINPVTTPVQDKNEIVGANPKYSVSYHAHRTSPDGVQNRFDTEAAAKTFIADGRGVTWKKSSAARPERALEAKKKGKAVNPWAVCTASAGREDKAKYERCIKDVKKKHPVKETQGMDYQLKTVQINESQEHSVMWLTLEEVRAICPSCASKMENRALSKIKVVYTEADKWPQTVRSNRFAEWCNESGHKGVTRDCLRAARQHKKAKVRIIAESYIVEHKLRKPRKPKA